eukprot:gene1013-4045_t
MGIHSFHHFVTRVKDFEAGKKACAALGLQLRETGRNPAMGLEMAFYDFAYGGFLEVVAPTRVDSVLRPALDKSGEGLNLLAL